MLGRMKYRLGLDLGTTSIGWALIRLDTEDRPQAIIKAGVRIFSDGRNAKDKTSLAVTRREARQARRRRDRLLKRKARMMDALIELSFFSKEESERKALLALDPYEIRRKGLNEALTGGEFARALFHINQRRGFKSNRKTDSKDEDSGALKGAIKELRDTLGTRTVGEWLAERHEKRLSVRARIRGKTQKDRAYDFYVDRAMIEHEFDEIWQKQSSLNPSLFSELARIKLKDILLFQRPLKPVRPGRCTLISEEERAPLALPSQQRFRIYQELNNLRFITESLSEGELTKGQRDQIAELLEHGDATFKTEIRIALHLSPGTKFNLQDGKRDRLKGNATSKILSNDKYFGDSWSGFSLAIQDEIVLKLVHEENERHLIEWLQSQYKLEESVAESIANVRLPDGYGSLSKSALDLILPELEGDVVTYDKAVKNAGFESHSALSLAEKTGEIHDELPYYGNPLERHVAFGTGDPSDPEEKRFGKIANPTVHIGLNEIRKVINNLIKKYGHPSEVCIEVARDLKRSKKLRDEISREQAVNQKRNELLVAEACEALSLNSENISKGRRRELSQKMQLWTELNKDDPLNRCCPYTGTKISISKLLSEKVEIEHIFPYSLSLDDSLTNKTVSIRQANRDKGNRVPYEAFGNDPEYNYDEILARAALMPLRKAKRFAPDGYQQWLRNDSDFLARALNDTAYLSRIAKEYLSLVCPPNKVRVIPGRMTSLLRGKFGLNSLLSGSDTKNRNDHRHHAIDACVVAITTQGLLQRISKASANAREKGLNQLIEEMPLPWQTFRDHAKRAVQNIIVSHRPDHGYQGAIMESSAYGILEDGKVRRRIVADDGRRETKVLNKTVIGISDRENKDRHGLGDDGTPRPYKGYVGGSNFCIEIYEDDKNKWVGEVVSTYRAYEIIRKHGETAGEKKLHDDKLTLSEKPLFVRLHKGDFVRLRVNDETTIYRLSVIKSDGSLLFCQHNEANVDARNRDKKETFSYLQKSAGALKKIWKGAVTVSPIGQVSIRRRYGTQSR